jgi:hypothetical protein
MYPGNVFEKIEGAFSEVDSLAHPRGLLYQCTFGDGADPEGQEYLQRNDRTDEDPLN